MIVKYMQKYYYCCIKDCHETVRLPFSFLSSSSAIPDVHRSTKAVKAKLHFVHSLQSVLMMEGLELLGKEIKRKQNKHCQI